MKKYKLFNMKTTIRILYLVTMLCCALGIYVEWKTGDSVVWPAIALFWCINAFTYEFKKDE